ncbi:MAG: sugar MFS transporter [Flavobacteriales bacterium]|nr:sugar MFS transporter [Flavobacteriales bacterium]MBK6943303.1 sugar MFS transporter [Flavobacteriales bacterium]MBK9536167.1 sugar MFS transporter [Flavobacteriales bacterium]MBP9139744.1 sugar MFS transporter [Flavobacteriales bacterium]HQV53439.1 sugar MFS transporter [Flavobacteriales bacterium]
MANGKQTTSAVIILGALFFLFGFTTWINGPLISYLKIICQLDAGAEPFYVTFAFYIAYFFTALPMAWVLGRTGMKLGMTYGLLTMALGALLFIPAAQIRSYPLFLLGLFVIGTGLSLLQTASNPYITVVGPIESAAARISIMGICNKMAGVLAPIVLGAVLLSDASTLQAELDALQSVAQETRLDEIASRVIMPYAVMAAILAALGLLVRWSPLPELEQESIKDKETHKARSVFTFPNLILGVIALFLYVGVEVVAVDTIGVYGEALGVSLDHAKLLPSYPLIAMVLAYIVGIACIPRFFSQTTALVVSALLGIVFALGVIFVPIGSVISLPGFDLLTFSATRMEVPVSVLFLALLGLANGLMWPAIWPLAINGLGRAINVGSAMLIMAIAGGAILPLIYGWFSALPSIGVQHAYWLLVPCYVYILWYGVKGSRILKW